MTHHDETAIDLQYSGPSHLFSLATKQKESLPEMFRNCNISSSRNSNLFLSPRALFKTHWTSSKSAMSIKMFHNEPLMLTSVELMFKLDNFESYIDDSASFFAQYKIKMLVKTIDASTCKASKKILLIVKILRDTAVLLLNPEIQLISLLALLIY